MARTNEWMNEWQAAAVHVLQLMGQSQIHQQHLASKHWARFHQNLIRIHDSAWISTKKGINKSRIGTEYKAEFLASIRVEFMQSEEPNHYWVEFRSGVQCSTQRATMSRRRRRIVIHVASRLRFVTWVCYLWVAGRGSWTDRAGDG